jgi:hypothetical protein
MILTNGILGEYIAKMYMETKRRPIYIAKSTNIEESGDSGSGDENGSSADGSRVCGVVGDGVPDVPQLKHERDEIGIGVGGGSGDGQV